MDGGADHTGADNFYFGKGSFTNFSDPDMWNSNCNVPTELSWFCGKFGKEKFGDSFTSLSTLVQSRIYLYSRLIEHEREIFNLFQKEIGLEKNSTDSSAPGWSKFSRYFCATFLSLYFE